MLARRNGTVFPLLWQLSPRSIVASFFVVERCIAMKRQCKRVVHQLLKVRRARVVHRLQKGRRSLLTSVWGPVEELPMKTRPDGSAFRRSNNAYGRQPSQPRPRNDGFHWATPRHPTKRKLTVCNRFAYFTFTNFGGRSKEQAKYSCLILRS